MSISVNISIILITIAISAYAWKNESFFRKWLFNPYRVTKNKEIYRFLTSGFIHGGWIHLAFNMFTLFFFGRNIEYMFQRLVGNEGKWIYLALYLSAIVISEIPTYIKYRNNSAYNSIGASGGVAAVVFAYIILFPTELLYLMGIIPIPGFLLGILYIVYSYYQGKRMADNINHDAHLVGALYGLVFTIILYPASVPRFFEQISEFRLF